MITVVGAGFAGVETAWAAANRGVRVRLYEMRPVQMTPAHTTDLFAELVCSNSFKSKLPTTPAGLLKGEMLALGSLVISTAMEHEVPGGEALAVDREAFGKAITKKIYDHPMIEVVREEFTAAMAEKALSLERETLGPNSALLLATGPLTSPELAQWLAGKTGRQHLYFYDAVSPTVEALSLDRNIIFAQSRYDKGAGDDYLNCPFEKDSYFAFVDALVAAERAPVHAFEAGGRRDLPIVDLGSRIANVEGDTKTPEEVFVEKLKYFAGCTPIEAIAEGGKDSLRFGNFKPVGLTDPRYDRRPYAALQLRPENKEKTLYSLVACQTRLKWGEQKRVFQMVPGLENAEFVRYGVIHRNTFLEAPRVLTPQLEMKASPGLFVTGQLTGVEGYVESAAMGIYSGIISAAIEHGRTIEQPPRACAYGSLVAHLQDETPREFAPMNINWGLLPDPEQPTRDKGVKRALKLQAADVAFKKWFATIEQEVAKV
jgi:methylenetetrahydrofolate--tRNA-(uracil-5-)-methyltransferase